MRAFVAALGLGLAVVSGGAQDFVTPAGGLIARTASTSASLRGAMVVGGHARWSRTPCSSSSSACMNPAMIFAAGAVRCLPSASGSATTGNATTARRRATATVLNAKASREPEAEGQGASSSAAMSGVGSVGSNVLLLAAVVLVVKGLLLPEDVRHLGFCPIEDPIRGRDTLPWRMLIESGRECGTITEVMAKYVTAPLAFPGTPEWGMMLNVKEDLAKDAWLQ